MLTTRITPGFDTPQESFFEACLGVRAETGHYGIKNVLTFQHISERDKVGTDIVTGPISTIAPRSRRNVTVGINDPELAIFVIKINCHQSVNDPRSLVTGIQKS